MSHTWVSIDTPGSVGVILQAVVRAKDEPWIFPQAFDMIMATSFQASCVGSEELVWADVIVTQLNNLHHRDVQMEPQLPIRGTFRRFYGKTSEQR